MTERDDRLEDIVSAEEFVRSFGEDLTRTLDLRTWHVGADLAHDLDRIEAEVRAAVQREEAIHGTVRTHLLPKLRTRANAPSSAGHDVATRAELEAIQQGLLFNGGVEACDGTLHVHDTLALTIYQVGITLVSYRGNQGTWSQRLFRRDLRQTCGNPVEETLAILERRAARGATRRDTLNELVQRSLLSYAERLILLDRSRAVWRIGHGNPVPYEMLTGGGCVELMEASVNVLRRLIEKHQKFLFVAREPRERHLITVGQALLPWEFAVVSTLAEMLEGWLHQHRFRQEADRTLLWDGRPLPAPQWIPRFIREVAPSVVVGVYRATTLAPAQVFYAHVDHADVAGRLAIADAMLQEQRGVPLLLDLARQVGSVVFGANLEGMAESAYAAVGTPGRYRPGAGG